MVLKVPSDSGTKSTRHKHSFVLAEGVNKDLDSCSLNQERTHLGIYRAALRENARPWIYAWIYE